MPPPNYNARQGNDLKDSVPKKHRDLKVSIITRVAEVEITDRGALLPGPEGPEPDEQHGDRRERAALEDGPCAPSTSLFNGRRTRGGH